MSNIISLATIRADKLKQALILHSRNGETVVIETRTGPMTATRITCRDRFIEILDVFGDYFVVDYNDIRDLHAPAVAQTSVVNARGEFLPAPNFVGPRPVAILPFARRSHRK
jgi:hypothetical protein